MYKIYIKQAWALIRQERFFSSVYIVGTGLAISMVMALAVAYHIRTANIAPEVHRDRMCYLSNVTYKLNGTKSNYKAACGPRLVKEVIGNLHVPEDVAVTTNSFHDAFLLWRRFHATARWRRVSQGEVERLRRRLLACLPLRFRGGAALHRGRVPLRHAPCGAVPLVGRPAVWARGGGGADDLTERLGVYRERCCGRRLRHNRRCLRRGVGHLFLPLRRHGPCLGRA